MFFDGDGAVISPGLRLIYGALPPLHEPDVASPSDESRFHGHGNPDAVAVMCQFTNLC